MISREEIFAYAKEKFEGEPDYPWNKYPDYAVLRHKKTNKWYGLIMAVPRDKVGLTGAGSVEIINVKGEPELNAALRSQEGILPAYHMNREHWLSIVLESTLAKDKIFDLLDMSYELTKKKTRKSSKNDADESLVKSKRKKLPGNKKLIN
jgi:predicted DNA-binding protein (MmcQ/YjbR family)